MKGYEKDQKTNEPSCIKYLNELTDNCISHKKKANAPSQINMEILKVKHSNSNLNHLTSIGIKNDELFENQFKFKSLIKLEEKEYFDQIITTTTTVRTLTTDDLFYLFDSSFYENHYHSSNVFNNLSDSNNKYSSKLQHNLNPNIYSCLTNYFSDVKNIPDSFLISN